MKPYPLECTNCKKKYLKPQGFCSCGSANIEPINKDTLEDRRIRRRWKGSERGIAKGMLAADGPDPVFKNIASSTSRTGHISGMRVDAVTRTYAIENKNKALPKWIIDAWVLIQQRAHDFDKHALLHLDPPNLSKDYPINGTRVKLDTMAVITQPRHEELIRTERAFNELVKDIEGGLDVLVAVGNAFAILNGQGKTSK